MIDEITDRQLSSYLVHKSRSMYYVQLKKEWALILRKKGYTLQHIADVILHNRDKHDVIFHYLNNHLDIPEADEIRENMFQWFEDKVIPLTIATKENKSTMVLRHLSNFIQQRYQNTKNADVNINEMIALVQMDKLIGEKL